MIEPAEVPLLKHMRWLDRVSSGPQAFITASVANLSRAVLLNAIKASGGELPIPSAGCGEDGELLMTWDRDELHLEAEVAADASRVEWFFCDRDEPPRSSWLEEVPCGAVPHAAFPILKLLAAPIVAKPLPIESIWTRLYYAIGGILYRLVGYGWGR